jgi:hypothetical protein
MFPLATTLLMPNLMLTPSKEASKPVKPNLA